MYNSTKISRLLPALALGVALSPTAALAAPFIEQPIVLPPSEWALDLGLGIGHLDLPSPLSDITGTGLNLELRGGIAPAIQVGIRTGVRIGSDGRATQADRYGRTFETETYGTGVETLANPELSLRVALVRTDAAALALEGRLYLPIEDGTKLGIMAALPLHLHLGPSARLDSGLYVPIIFTDPTSRVFSIPVHLWFQANPAVALGLLTGVRFYRPADTTTVPLGVGLNYGLSSLTDLRGWFLFPNVRNDATGNFGFGVGIEARF